MCMNQQQFKIRYTLLNIGYLKLVYTNATQKRTTKKHK